MYLFNKLNLIIDGHKTKYRLFETRIEAKLRSPTRQVIVVKRHVKRSEWVFMDRRASSSLK